MIILQFFCAFLKTQRDCGRKASDTQYIVFHIHCRFSEIITTACQEKFFSHLEVPLSKCKHHKNYKSVKGCHNYLCKPECILRSRFSVTDALWKNLWTMWKTIDFSLSFSIFPLYPQPDSHCIYRCIIFCLPICL